MKHSLQLVLSIALILAARNVQAAGERPATSNRDFAVDAMTPIGLGEIKIAGEIGLRLDITVNNNLLALDTENAFLVPFRQRNQVSGYVGLGKLIDATVRFAAYTKAEKVLALKNRLVAEAIKTQEPDGYIGILVPESRLWGVYDIHEMSYLVLGLTNDYKYFGEQASLSAARRLADFILARWSAEPSRIPGPTGKRANMYGVTTGLDGALLTLFEQTKDQRYLDFCIKSEQYKLPEWNSTIKMDEANKPYNMDDERHAYIFMCLCVAQLQLYNLQADPRLLKQAQQALDFLTRQDGLLISGSCSLNEAWHDNQVGSGNVSESCATAYLTRLMDREIRLTGNSQFGNMMERTVYNALFAAESPDGRSLRYFCPLEGIRTYFDRDTFCCPNNFRRIMAELPAMIYYRSNDGVAVNLYTESTARVDLGVGRSVTIQQETDYPTSGLVRIVVTPSEAMEFPLRLRIPGWCPKAKLAINGQTPVEVSPGESFYEIRRVWKPADSVTLDMPMPWRFVRGRKSQEGRAALMRGPVVYCFGTANNAELTNKYQKPGDLILDPASLGTPVSDTSVRPDGLKVLAKAWPPERETKDPAPLDVVLTEFVDPSCITTYFRLPDLTRPVDDELMNKTSVGANLTALPNPRLIKLPLAFPTGMENTPVVFNDRPLLVDNHRPGGFKAKGEDAYLFITDLTTGQEVARFGKGHSFVSAFVNGPELNVFATEFTDFGDVINTKCINRFSTTDLKTWKQEMALARDGAEQFFNTSVCRDDEGYLMAYESNIPVQWCFRFARSKDLSHWEKIAGLEFADVEGKTACANPTLRFFDPYYYVIYGIHRVPNGPGAHYEYLLPETKYVTAVARSKDLVTWELSPTRGPMLDPVAGEGINNTDADLFEFDGNTYVYYATGDQATWGTIRVAMYAGPMREMLDSYFPDGPPMIRFDAKQQRYVYP